MAVKSRTAYTPGACTIFKNIDPADSGDVVTLDVDEDTNRRFISMNESIYTLNQRDRAKFEFHNCTHRKYLRIPNCGAYTFYVGATPYTRRASDFHSLLRLAVDSVDNNGTSALLYDLHPDLEADWHNDCAKSHLDWEGLSGNAFEAMKPSLETPLSLTQFLAEIRDLKRLFKMWDSRHGWIANVSGAHLGYQFGWKQLVRDIKQMIMLVVNYSERLDDFLARANTVQRRYYMQHLDPVDFATKAATDNNGYAHVEHSAKILSAEYRAVMVYDYDVPDLAMPELQRRALLDSLGLDLKPSTIWNLIPFSFVVDWFLNVSLFLSSRERDWLEPALTIRHFSHSVKYLFEGEIKASYRGGSLWWVDRYSGTGYRRWSQIPSIGTTIGSTGFSTGRLAIGASLLGVRYK